MRLGPFEKSAADLAPGDASVLDADWSQFSVESVRSPDAPVFADAYARLWNEFGRRGEMERREVIVGRLAWDPHALAGDHALLYELLVVRRGGDVVAVRDHTAIASRARPTDVVVHLSHVLVEPALRGSGLAAWLRALPMQPARACAAAAGATSPARITLVAEMEHPDQETPAGVARLRSYARAGFSLVAPEQVPYMQPDFRDPGEIDCSAPQPLPLVLVVRRVGRERETHMQGGELREIVNALHTMFGMHVRADHMAPLRSALARFPAPGDTVALVPPWPKPEPGSEKPR